MTPLQVARLTDYARAVICYDNSIKDELRSEYWETWMWFYLLMMEEIGEPT